MKRPPRGREAWDQPREGRRWVTYTEVRCTSVRRAVRGANRSAREGKCTAHRGNRGARGCMCTGGPYCIRSLGSVWSRAGIRGTAAPAKGQSGDVSSGLAQDHQGTAGREWIPVVEELGWEEVQAWKAEADRGGTTEVYQSGYGPSDDERLYRCPKHGLRYAGRLGCPVCGGWARR